ncbi:MAG: hypothetical protein QG673_1050 [Pseudomonadota bacterium]|nr:hypothetical protein [Pseudomonadota bacterium]
MASTGVAKQYSAYRDLSYTLNIVKKVNVNTFKGATSANDPMGGVAVA